MYYINGVKSFNLSLLVIYCTGIIKINVSLCVCVCVSRVSVTGADLLNI